MKSMFQHRKTWVFYLMFVAVSFKLPYIAHAQSCIPSNAVIDSATLTLSSEHLSNQTISIHRVNSEWDEESVTWQSFSEQYDPTVETTFETNSFEPRTADLTPLVQWWLEGHYPNHGILLEQGLTDYSFFTSSEREDVDKRPKLDVCYSSSNESQCITYQRTSDQEKQIEDTYIWSTKPDKNSGTSDYLFSGAFDDGEKQILLQFDITVCADPISPGTGSPRYWRNHLEDWPVDDVLIGGVSYSRFEAFLYMWIPGWGDRTYSLFRSLVAAKLNVLIGNESSCIERTIARADRWFEKHGPVGGSVRAWSRAWRKGKRIHRKLSRYNKGRLCAPAR